MTLLKVSRLYQPLHEDLSAEFECTAGHEPSLDPMQPMPQSICAIVCIYVYFGPTQRLLPGVIPDHIALARKGATSDKSNDRPYNRNAHTMLTMPAVSTTKYSVK